MSEQDNQVVEATNSTEEVELVVDESTTESEAVESPEAEVKEETVPKSQFNQVLARAKKAEALLKNKPKESINNVLSEETIEEKILLSQGLSSELIDELKALSKVRGKSLLATTTDPIFVAIKEAKEKEVKEQKARLGASKGSGSVKKEKSFTTPGLTPEEHKEMWKSSQGR